MNEQSAINKKAWEYRAYDHWLKNDGLPEERAKIVMENPMARLGQHGKYFRNINGLKIANPCGSNGRRAVPLALLGADVTIFDISEENEEFPSYSLRLYNISEILNSMIKRGFIIKEFNEAPSWTNKKLPGEFTVYAIK